MPDHVAALWNYARYAFPPDPFLQAILEGQPFRHACPAVRDLAQEIREWIEAELPMACYGYRGVVAEYCQAMRAMRTSQLRWQWSLTP